MVLSPVNSGRHLYPGFCFFFFFRLSHLLYCWMFCYRSKMDPVPCWLTLRERIDGIILVYAHETSCYVFQNRLIFAIKTWTLTLPIHFSANGCLLPLCAVDGMAVTTVEGIGSTKTALHPVQVNTGITGYTGQAIEGVFFVVILQA